ncbi:MAG: hypothetical protein LBP22_02040 [Deltaproteobacteria bacterium]|nr:hypothetical protein [Deltaproteobacteria bacterium]
MGRLDRELAGVKALCPNAAVQGVADGATSNWAWLIPRADVQALYFYHLSTYISKVSDILFAKNSSDREEWTETWLNKIKCSNNGADLLIDGLEERREALKKPSAEELDKVLVRLNNQKERTHYRRERTNNRPIGSGVIEAACKKNAHQTTHVLLRNEADQRWGLKYYSNLISYPFK